MLATPVSSWKLQVSRSVQTPSPKDCPVLVDGEAVTDGITEVHLAISHGGAETQWGECARSRVPAGAAPLQDLRLSM